MLIRYLREERNATYNVVLGLPGCMERIEDALRKKVAGYGEVEEQGMEGAKLFTNEGM